MGSPLPSCPAPSTLVGLTCLSVAVESDFLGSTVSEELVPGGSRLAVTQGNLLQVRACCLLPGCAAWGRGSLLQVQDWCVLTTGMPSCAARGRGAR